MAGRKNRKSSDYYSKRAGYDGKSKRRGYKCHWNGTDGQPRKGARIGADAQTWKRVDVTSREVTNTHYDARGVDFPTLDQRCVVCHDPGGVRATSDAPRLHRGCARRLARRGMRADLNRAAAQARIREADMNARDLASRAAARELKSVGAPSLTPWTASDVADLADKAAPVVAPVQT